MSAKKDQPELSEAELLAQWRAGIEDRAKCWSIKQPQRGLRSGPRPVAATAWRCEGQWQADEQMDIWQCLDEVELDERRKHGLDDEDDDDGE